MQSLSSVRADEYNNKFEYNVALVCKNIINKFNLCETPEEVCIRHEFSTELPLDKIFMLAVSQTLSERGIETTHTIIEKQNKTVLFFRQTSIAKTKTAEEDESSVDIGVMLGNSLVCFPKKIARKSFLSKKEAEKRRIQEYEDLDPYNIEVGIAKYMR